MISEWMFTPFQKASMNDIRLILPRPVIIRVLPNPSAFTLHILNYSSTSMDVCGMCTSSTQFLHTHDLEFFPRNVAES